ncbi:MAG: metal ABC transporter permease [Phycisphaeraceae bacterium]|nr:MAG: metal ABC transporter permease [Phycisphaeraceae bacterium]
MRTLEYLRELPEVFWPPCVVALCLVPLCSVLSVIVCLKRLAFIGQGISHAGFGGIGVAAVLGLVGTGLTASQTVAQFAVVVGFCAASAVVVGVLSGRGRPGGGAGTGGPAGGADTAIGIVLVASMALGAVLVHVSSSNFAWESFLFGYLLGKGWADVWVALSASAGVLGALWWARRPLLFWAFDEPSAEAFGVRARGVRVGLMILLALATVTTMKLAGVVMASALLVLPGATALLMSARLGAVMWASVGVALVGVVGGLVLSFEANWPPGPAIVTVLTVEYLAARVVSGVRGGA